MTLTKKQIISILLLLALVFSLPVAIYLTRKMQDIRPRALQGKANFLLSTDSISSTVGKNIDVLVTLQTTDPALKVSGVDFLLLYDKNRLDVGNIVPNVIAVDPKAPFTDAPIVTSGGSFDENFNFIRVTEIARRPDADLPKGTFQLAKITFRGRGTGSATIKFPDEDKYLEIVGTGASSIFQNINPTSTPILTITPGGPTLTPTPTLRPGQPSNTPIPQQGGGGGGGGGGTGGRTGGSGGVGGTGGTLGSGGRQGCQVTGCRTAGECCAASGNCVKCPQNPSPNNGICEKGESNAYNKGECTGEKQIGGSGSVTSYLCGQQCDAACGSATGSGLGCGDFCRDHPGDCAPSWRPVGTTVTNSDGSTITYDNGISVTTKVDTAKNVAITVTKNASGAVTSTKVEYKNSLGTVIDTDILDGSGKVVSQTTYSAGGSISKYADGLIITTRISDTDKNVTITESKNVDGNVFDTKVEYRNQIGTVFAEDHLDSSGKIVSQTTYNASGFVTKHSDGTINTYTKDAKTGTGVLELKDASGNLISKSVEYRNQFERVVGVDDLDASGKIVSQLTIDANGSVQVFYNSDGSKTIERKDKDGNVRYTQVCDVGGNCNYTDTSSAQKPEQTNPGGAVPVDQTGSINQLPQIPVVVDKAEKTGNVGQAVNDVVTIVTEKVQNAFDAIRDIFNPPSPAVPEPPPYVQPSYEPSKDWSWSNKLEDSGSSIDSSGGGGSSGFGGGDVGTVDTGINWGDFHRSEDWY